MPCLSVIAKSLVPQGNDLPADSLERRLRQRGFSRLASIWRKGISRAVDDGVGGLMDLAVSLENLLYGTTTTSQLLGESLVHRTSIVGERPWSRSFCGIEKHFLRFPIGLYLRRLVLQFNRLTFHEVSHLLQNFQSYFQTDKQVPNVGMGRLNGRKEVEDGLGEDKTGQFLHQQSEVYSRRQAEFYIAQQVRVTLCVVVAIQYVIVSWPRLSCFRIASPWRTRLRRWTCTRLEF